MTITDDRPRPETIEISVGEGDERRPVLAERTTTPGLWITTQFLGPRMSGEFVITHEGSGRVIPIFSSSFPSAPLEACRRVAEALGTIGVDWTTPTDELQAQLVGDGVRQRIADAIHAGKYPPVDPDPDGTEQPGPDRWPLTEQQATARQVAEAFTIRALVSLREFTSRVGKLPPKPGDDADPATVAAFRTAADEYVMWIAMLSTEFATVTALRALIKADPALADDIARTIWESIQHGDSIGEWLHAYAVEYGIDPAQYNSDDQ